MTVHSELHPNYPPQKKLFRFKRYAFSRLFPGKIGTEVATNNFFKDLINEHRIPK